MKISLNSIGCRLNQAEIEKFANQLVRAGHELVPSEEQADVVILNTCTVTNHAASDSRGMVRRSLKNQPGRIIVTGCLSTLDPDSIAKIDPSVMIIDNNDKDNLVNQVIPPIRDLRPPEHVTRVNIPGMRHRTRAFIKAQDGCDNFCTFCVTRLARGKSRSVSADVIIKDVLYAENSGVKEVVLSGVQLGSWGSDLVPQKTISDLVKSVLAATTNVRVRLSSIEPWGIPGDFFQLWNEERICRQLHIPLQSGSDRILKKMGRKNTTAGYKRLVDTIRKICPEIAITTDILVGFPGESSDDFDETCVFMKSLNFAGGHVFTYSPRPGTVAAMMKNQIPHVQKAERSRFIRSLLMDLQQKYYRCFLQKELDILWESAQQQENGSWRLKGISDNYIRVYATYPKNLCNQISKVCMIEAAPSGIFGNILSEQQAVNNLNTGDQYASK